MEMPSNTDILYMLLIGGFVLLLFIAFIGFLTRYKRCPSDRIMVIYGRVGEGRSARCMHGGAAFVLPIIQDYQFLDLRPMSIDIQLNNALSKQNIRVSVPSTFTIGITTDPEKMGNAAERLLGLNSAQITQLAKEIIFGQMRQVVAAMRIEEINADRDQLIEAINRSGTVYMRIPEMLAGAGEIQISFGGRMQNVRAYTRGIGLPTGTAVKVVGLHGDQALLVEKL